MVSRGVGRTGQSGTSDVFVALADQRRRDILGMLTTGEMSIQAIADNFDVTRPAVVKHLGVLKRASLVRTRRHGRERLYRLEAGPLRAVQEWLLPYERFWMARLQRLKADVEQG
jgi:DNA-binding transcriptional ArsR family regulator